MVYFKFAFYLLRVEKIIRFYFDFIQIYFITFDINQHIFFIIVVLFFKAVKFNFNYYYNYLNDINGKYSEMHLSNTKR